MTDTNPTTARATAGDAQAIIDVTREACEPAPLDLGDARFYTAVVPAGGRVEVIDLEKHLDQFRSNPRRKAGSFTVQDAASFVAYLEKHGVQETEVWADVERAAIVGVINAHEGTDVPVGDDGPLPGWGDHRVQFSVRHTDAWKAWIALDGKLVTQSQLAEHLEDRSVDIVRPVAADMLEVAQTFQATVGVSFESSKQLSSGVRQFEYKETVDAKAGRAGRLEIPKDFDLALRPFEGADPYRVLARFRYRIEGGNLRIGYKLERPADILREAFLGVLSAIEGEIEHPVYRGTSA